MANDSDDDEASEATAELFTFDDEALAMITELGISEVCPLSLDSISSSARFVVDVSPSPSFSRSRLGTHTIPSLLVPRCNGGWMDGWMDGSFRTLLGGV